MRGLRLRRIGEVGDDVWMRCIEVACGVAQIGLLGDRQRDDADTGIGQCIKQLCRIARRDQHRSDRADDAKFLAVAAALGERVEPVLRFERIVGRGALQRCADDAPVRLAGGKAVVDIGGLMRAVERADAEMHDARRDRGAVIARNRHRGRQGI